jgi:CDC45-like protein
LQTRTHSHTHTRALPRSQRRPVSGYADVAAAHDALMRGNADLRSVCLLGCGARRNVGALLPELPERASVYIADAHRPVHLANIHK